MFSSASLESELSSVLGYERDLQKTIWINLRRGGEAGFGKVEGYIYIHIYIVDL